MTDLEMVKKCAELMGLGAPRYRFVESGSHLLDEASGFLTYDPLHKDAQAMELLKKFRLTIDDANDGGWFVVGIGGAQAENADLNRAIVECVSKLGN